MSAAAFLAACLLGAIALWPGRGGLRVAREAPESPPRRSRRSRRRPPERGWEDVARVADVLAMALRAGASPSRATEVVAAVEEGGDLAPLLRETHAVLAAGAPAGPTWARFARERPELAFTAGAWRLSEGLGVSLAPAMSTTAEMARAQVTTRRRLAAATAGPRSTMLLLTVLPLAGVLGGYAFGLSPFAVYGHSALTMMSLVAGLVLTAVGWVACRLLLARALRPGAAPHGG